MRTLSCRRRGQFSNDGRPQPPYWIISLFPESLERAVKTKIASVSHLTVYYYRNVKILQYVHLDTRQ